MRKAVIPAAGQGRRFYPLTRAQPKEMLPVLGKPVIQYVVEEALNSGLDEILIVSGYGKDAIMNYFDWNEMDEEMDNSFHRMPDIYFVRQKRPRGLGDAVMRARGFTGREPFAVLLGDTLYTTDGATATSQLLSIYKDTGKPCILVENVKAEDVSRYGIISPEPFGVRNGKRIYRVKGIVEKPSPSAAPSTLAVTGLYVFGPEIYDYIERAAPDSRGELQLTDGLAMLAAEDELLAVELSGKRYDIGSLDLWIDTFVEFAEKRHTIG